MELDNDSNELSLSRLFIHARLDDPMIGGPLYYRIRAVDGGLVEYEEIYHRDDGAERVGSPWRLPIGVFIEETVGSWYEGTSPPPMSARVPRGHPVPLDPRKIGGRPAGSRGLPLRPGCSFPTSSPGL